MRVNPHGEDNPVTKEHGRWFQLPQYPDGVYVCPLCGLPETEGEYEFECDCWD